VVVDCSRSTIQGGNKLQASSKTEPREPKTETQTKPECLRKEGAYKNISQALGWLRATVSSLLKPGPNKTAIRADGNLANGHFEEVGS
jgi:hypothetical protein